MASTSQEMPPAATLLLPPITALPASSSRRLPPPCWTPDETSALIDAYRDKWYALRRAHLRATHWDQVADEVHRRCPHAASPKTALQCRHKMEKLRKRYRDELRRAGSIPHHRFSSSWTFFPVMDSMEKGPALNSSPPVVATVVSAAADDEDEQEESNDTEEEEEYEARREFNGKLGLSYHTSNAIANTNPNPSLPKYGYGWSSKYDGYDCSGLRIRYTGGAAKKKKRTRSEEVAMELVDAVRMVGEGFVRTEKMKMEMMRESERMRMEMEMKRTQMILDSQHTMLRAFFSSNNNS